MTYLTKDLFTKPSFLKNKPLCRAGIMLTYIKPRLLKFKAGN